MAPASADSKPMYAKDEKALCFHGELLYEAKVLEVKKIDPKDKSSAYEYRVHYKGWKNTWDDWVTQDRLRKLTDDNKELAANLRREVQQQSAQAKRPTAPSKTRKQGSELGSGRGSEERHSSVPAGGRGTKRGRDNDIEKPRPAMPVTARTKVTPATPAKKSGPKVKVVDNGKQVDVADVLSRSPPPDEDEWLSKDTVAAMKADPDAVPILKPLIGGTTAQEKQSIRQDLINAGAKLIPKAEWRQILRDNGIHPANQAVTETDIRLDLWLQKCIPARWLPVDKRQWCHFSWLMDDPIETQPHETFKEARREGDYAKMLLFEKAKPGQKISIAGVAKYPLVLDPPGSGGPFDAIRPNNHACLVEFLNTREFWEEEGWTEEALKKIPWITMNDVRPNVLAKFPWDVINSWPQRLQDMVPFDAPFYAAKDGVPVWEAARKAKAAPKQEAAAPSAPQTHRVRPSLPSPEPKFPGKKPRKQKRPMYNPNAVRDVTAEWSHADSPSPPNNNDSDGTVEDADRNRLMDTSPLRDASARLHLGSSLSSPPRPVQDTLPSSPAAIAPIQQQVISISSDETVIEAGGNDKEDYKVPDGTFLNNAFLSSDLPKRNDWLPISTKHSDNDDEEFLAQGSHPDYWLNVVFRNLPVHDSIYDCLEALYPLSDEFKQEEHFATRPSIRLSIPDQLKSLLVDDWENVTKSLLLVPLPSQAPANFIIDTYFNEEKNNRRLGSADADLLIELCCGLKLYFEKAVGKILLYRFERLQLAEVRKLWESGRYPEWEGKGPGDCYGAEHLTRMIVNMPEIIAQTNMDQQSIARLKEELTKFCTWLSRNSPKFFCAKYEKPSAEYVEAAR